MAASSIAPSVSTRPGPRRPRLGPGARAASIAGPSETVVRRLSGGAPWQDRRMPRTIDLAERRARLARRHRLLPELRTDDVAAIADGVVALHSTDPATVYLSAMLRMEQPSVEAV